MRTFETTAKRGYILQELIVGVVVFAICLVPLLRAVARLPELGSRVGQQSRGEAWRSTVDQVVLLGIDPDETGVMSSLADRAQTQNLLGQTARTAAPRNSAAPAGTQLVLLHHAFSHTAEARAVAVGFELGAADASSRPMRENPLPPLPPRKLPQPTITSPNSPVVQASQLTDSGVPGAPFIAGIRAVGEERVQLRQISPYAKGAAGLGSASLEVDAVALFQTVRGVAWSEYVGNPETDIAVPVAGRTRWIVQRGRQREVVEPSDPVDFDFTLRLGRPIYRIGETEHPSGSEVPVNYALAREIESGRVLARIDFSNATKAVFGRMWESVAPFYDWEFGAFTGGAIEGSTATLFGAAMRPTWSDSQVLRATPRFAMASQPAFSGTWRLERVPMPLTAPERVPRYYDGVTDEPGAIDFVAGTLPELGLRLGRPEVDGVESLGETLTVWVLP